MMRKIFMTAVISLSLWNSGAMTAENDLKEVILSMEELALSLNLMTELAEREQDGDLKRIISMLKKIYVKESTAGREKASLFLTRNKARIFLTKLKRCRTAECDSLLLRDTVVRTAEAFRKSSGPWKQEDSMLN